MCADYESDGDSGEIIDGFVILEAPREPHSELNRYMNVWGYFCDSQPSVDTEIDPRTCEHCAETLTTMLKDRLKEEEEDFNSYKKFLEELKTESIEEDVVKLEMQLEKFLLEEAKLRYELALAKLDEGKITKEYDFEMERQNGLLKEEDDYFQQHSKLLNDYFLKQEEIINLKSLFKYTLEKVDHLDKTNIFDATFQICQREQFATINGFRIGHLFSTGIEWWEINAAWGQISLLLRGLAKKVGFQFNELRLIPNGSHSYIEVIPRKKYLPLFGSGSSKYRWDNKFDKGMVAFLQCVQQFKESENVETFICFPYRINGHKLEDPSSGASYSIRTQFNCGERWTKCLKFLLTNLKWSIMSLHTLDNTKIRL